MKYVSVQVWPNLHFANWTLCNNHNFANIFHRHFKPLLKTYNQQKAELVDKTKLHALQEKNQLGNTGRKSNS